MSVERNQIIESMLGAGMFVFEPVVTNPSGKVETYYAEMAGMYAIPEIHHQVADWHSQLLARLEFDHICGIETASLPLVGALGYKDNLSTIYLRKNRKPYGTRKLIEGKFERGDSIYLIDDVSVEAEIPTMGFVKAAEAEGLVVKGVIVTMEIVAASKGRDVFVNNGYEFYSMFTYEDLADVADQARQKFGLPDNVGDLIIDNGD